jgi:hypothetical protein
LVFPNSHAVRDFDLVDVPFPERGEPRLIEGGAGHQREDASAGAETPPEVLDAPTPE